MISEPKSGRDAEMAFMPEHIAGAGILPLIPLRLIINECSHRSYFLQNCMIA